MTKVRAMAVTNMAAHTVPSHPIPAIRWNRLVRERDRAHVHHRAPDSASAVESG